MGRLIVKKAIEEGLNVVQAFDIVNIGKDAGEIQYRAPFPHFVGGKLDL